jgi:hypothetical protein
MPDPFGSIFTGPRGPYQQAFAIAPDDAQDLPTFAAALWVGTGGSLTVMLRGMTTPVTIPNVAASTAAPVPLYVRRVYATGTTASNLIGLA